MIVHLAKDDLSDIRSFTIGKVVFVGEEKKPSHVMGFSVNCQDEIELIVKIDGERFVHPFSEISI